MRWDDLFADLDAQVREDERRERDSEVADRTRRERAQVDLVGRLVANRGQDVSVRLRGGLVVSGSVSDVGADWVLLSDERGSTQSLVPVTGILSLSGMSLRSAPTGHVLRRFGVGVALRAVSRDRAAVTCYDIAGGQLTGTIDVVGADALDLTFHPLDLARRSGNVGAATTLPFAAIAAVRQRP